MVVDRVDKLLTNQSLHNYPVVNNDYYDDYDSLSTNEWH